MARNLPSGDTNRITIGPGVVYIGPAGATPAYDVGYNMDAMTIKVARSAYDVKAGAPQLLIKRLAHEENVSIEFKGSEQNMHLLSQAIGDGVTSMAGDPNEYLQLGGKQSFVELALRYQHIMSDGSTLTYDFYKAVGSGEVELGMNVDSPHEYPMHFDAMYVSTDWAGAALASGANLVKVNRIKA